MVPGATCCKPYTCLGVDEFLNLFSPVRFVVSLKRSLFSGDWLLFLDSKAFYSLILRSSIVTEDYSFVFDLDGRIGRAPELECSLSCCTTGFRAMLAL